MNTFAGWIAFFILVFIFSYRLGRGFGHWENSVLFESYLSILAWIFAIGFWAVLTIFIEVVFFK